MTPTGDKIPVEFTSDEIEALNSFRTAVQNDPSLLQKLGSNVQPEMLNRVWGKIEHAHQQYAGSTS